jgi:uncharacterized membrane protein YesL
MRLFDLDSKFMHYANRFADLMGLNLLTFIFCLPVITAGASLTAMHRVLLAIYRDEESYITKSFWKSFKENFKQSTIIWLIYLGLITFAVTDFILIYKGGIQIHAFFKYALGFVALLIVFSFMWVFVLQSRYENKVFQTIKNSIVVGCSHFAYSLMMVILAAAPILLALLWEMAMPFVFLFGFTAPGLLQTMLYSRVFDRIEGIDRKALKEQEKEDDGWTIEEEPEEINDSLNTEEVPALEGENGQVDERKEN